MINLQSYYNLFNIIYKLKNGEQHFKSFITGVSIHLLVRIDTCALVTCYEIEQI